MAGKYWYLNGKLHKVLRVDRPKDLVDCYIFSEEKYVMYAWTAFKKNRRPAFRRAEVSKFINRHPIVVNRYIEQGKINPPEKSHELTTKAPGDYYWSEDDILGLHDYLLTVHSGYPRKDGRKTTRNVPTRAELIAMMRTEQVIYAQKRNGEFVPVWRAEDW